MPTINGDKITLISTAGTVAFNDPLLTGWTSPLSVRADDLLGWRKTVSLNVISVPRGVGDGAYTASRFPAESRMLYLSGYVRAINRAALDQAADELALMAFPQDVDIQLVYDEPVPKYVICRLADSIEVTQYLPDEGMLRFEVPLLCSDPFKYDASGTVSGSTGIAGLSLGGRTYPRVYPLQYITTAAGTGNQVILTNIGTAVALPIITLTGPVSIGWRIENSTNGIIQGFNIGITTGDILIIDNNLKLATLNGSTINGLLIGDWMSLSQGSNTLRLFADYNSTATMTVEAISRWR